MKGTELADCLSKARYLDRTLEMIADDIVVIGSDEGEHYLLEARNHICKACSMLRRYCIFIKENADDNSTRTSRKDDDDDDYYDYI